MPWIRAELAHVPATRALAPRCPLHTYAEAGNDGALGGSSSVAEHDRADEEDLGQLRGVLGEEGRQAVVAALGHAEHDRRLERLLHETRLAGLLDRLGDRAAHREPPVETGGQCRVWPRFRRTG